MYNGKNKLFIFDVAAMKFIVNVNNKIQTPLKFIDVNSVCNEKLVESSKEVLFKKELQHFGSG